MSETGSLSTQKRKTKKTLIVTAIWLSIVVGLVLIVNWRDNRNAEIIAQQNLVEEIPWNPQILSCNLVLDATPSDDLTACIEMAKEGWLDPMYRLVYAYLQEGEYMDWEQSYYWARRLTPHDYYAEVFKELILMNYAPGETNQLKGEKGIRKLASIGRPIAKTYLAALYYLNLNTLQQQESIQWLLQRAYAENKYWLPPTDYAIMHVSGILGPIQSQKAKAILDEAIVDDFSTHANNIAWLLSTSSNPALIDAKRALDIAKQIVEEEGESIRAFKVDTLAAAYAATGDFTSAITEQKRAIDLATEELGNAESLEEELVEYQGRLALYENKMPYFDEASSKENEEFVLGFKMALENDLYDSFLFEMEDKSDELSPETTE